VDFSIFSREAIGMFLSEWKAYIREADPIHPVLADNVGTAVRNNGWIRSHDDEILAKSVDRTGLSFYVKHNEKSTYTDWERCQLLESSAFTSPDRRFWVAEMQSHHRALFNPFGTVSAEDIRMWNWEALSHGANGIVYWKWEPFIKGHQTFGRGLVNHNGKFMPRALEAQKVNSLIQENAEEFAECTPEIPETAILFDPENMDIIREYVYPNTSVVSETIYNDGIKGLYQSLWEENIPATFILPGHLNSENTKNIKTIFTSNQIKITGELAEQLKTFVKNGGTLINDGLFGFVNDRAVLHGDLPGGPLSDIIGLDLEDVACNDLTFSLSTESGQIKFEGFFERLITAVTGDDTQTVSSFPNGDPAVTESRYGNGRIIHILTMFWYGVYKAAASQGRELIRYIDSRFSLSRHSCSNSQVHYRMLQGRKRSILILRNYSRERVHCEFIPSQGYREDTQIRDLHTGDRTLLKRGNPLQTEIEGRDVKVFMMEASEDST
jgi:beta-galactosidase GanA